MAREISSDLSGLEPVFIGVLRGSAVFLSDLVRRLDFSLSLDFVAVSSYSGTTSTGVVKITKDLDDNLESRHAVLVEDIVDSGSTLQYLVQHLEGQNPASLRVCTLLSRIRTDTAPAPVDYVGFKLERGYVVGYGMDYRQRFRNLPFIGLLEDS
jgi:hypoxanthine phosphoribosyltransferase